MSRIPPALLYLTIYNPTLRPDISAIHDDDDDAEEQAQILFYTSRDRAVSRDKMLRQVGLAKALVNFAEMFHSTDPCQNVHSQTRRMVMVNPEPNFWMHVAVELAKTPRTPPAKPKSRDNGKGKAKEEQSQGLQLEYLDEMPHDFVIRAHLMRGYEQFKLIHGSFSSILSSSGQQALERQLERFFTVWAWSWDLDNDVGFGTHLGLPLHPLHQSIHPIVDDFSSQIPKEATALVLTQTHVIPSSTYKGSRYPVALARHLMSQIILNPTPTALPVKVTRSNNQSRTSTESPSSGGFLGVNISTSMDVRKWSWPSFGKGPGPKEFATNASNGVVPHPPSERAETQVDQGALEDAIASENSFGIPMEKRPPDSHEKHPAKQGDVAPEADTPRLSRAPSPTPDPSEPTSNCVLQGIDASSTVDSEKLQFTWGNVFLTPSNEPLATSQKRVYLLKRGQYALALVSDELDDVDALVKPSLRLLDDVERIVTEDNRRNVTTSPPSVTNILQPKDSHALKTGDYVNAGVGMVLSSDYLFEAKGLLDREPGVIEVFSRGLHPQHWHVVSRVIVDDEKGEAYLRVSRKEATLSDVDNILRGLYKTYC